MIASKTAHMAAVPNEDTGKEGGSGQWSNRERDPKVSVPGTTAHQEERKRGQMSKVISVRRDKLRLGYHLLLGACGRAGAKTMPTPLCDDQCLRRLCKMAAVMPTHYYESLALHFFFLFLIGSAICE